MAPMGAGRDPRAAGQPPIQAEAMSYPEMAIDLKARAAAAAAYDATFEEAYEAHLEGKGKGKRALAACVADQTIARVARGAAAAAYDAAIEEVYDAAEACILHELYILMK